MGSHQNTEGDFADKESDDENFSLKAVIRTKKASKFSGNLEESDSELESRDKTPTKKGRGGLDPKTPNQKVLLLQFQNPLQEQKRKMATIQQNQNWRVLMGPKRLLRDALVMMTLLNEEGQKVK